jgi:TPR repeat protein
MPPGADGREMRLHLRSWLTWALLLVAVSSHAQPADPELVRGVAQVRDGDLEGGTETLSKLVRRLGSDPRRDKDAAQAHLHLGVAYSLQDQEKAARASFREALRLDASVALSADLFPPKAIRAFESVRAENAPAPPTPAPSVAPLTGKAAAPDAACRAGDLSSCVAVAWLYETGDGAPKDLRRAAELYSRACGGGVLAGCNNLGGLALAEGDLARAMSLYAKACEGSFARGCSNQAWLYEAGKGVAADPPRAVALYARACDLSDAVACGNLGAMVQHGNGAPLDETRATALYERACSLGDMHGCTNGGWMYDMGRGVAMDPRRAMALYGQGCQSGSGLGCSNLGAIFERGRGVAVDLARARSYYQQACGMQDPSGCENLRRLGPEVTR